MVKRVGKEAACQFQHDAWIRGHERKSIVFILEIAAESCHGASGQWISEIVKTMKTVHARTDAYPYRCQPRER